MELMLVGVSHRDAMVELRERLAVPARALPDMLHAIRNAANLSEAVILSTCNRTEIYGMAPDAAVAQQAVIDVLSHHSRLPVAAFRPRLQLAAGQDVVRHLFRVASGLESMILGESEISAQVKQAYLSAQAAGTTGPWLDRLFQKSLHCGKMARTRTGIASGQASLGSVVLKLAQQEFGDRLSTTDVLLWGAGKAAEATTKHLVTNGIGQLWIVNRTQSKAEALACLSQGRWLSWEQAVKHLAHVDIAIICTQAPHYVIDQADLEPVLAARQGRPLFVLDLAVPRNVDPQLRSRPGLKLYDIDDLECIANAGRSARAGEVIACEAIIEAQLSHFSRWQSLQRGGLQQEDVLCENLPSS